MTLEEVNLLKKAILDANEIYIKELLKNAKFNKDEKAVDNAIQRIRNKIKKIVNEI